MNNITGVMP